MLEDTWMRSVDNRFVDISKQSLYRIISSQFPVIGLFEDVADPEDLETVYAIEAMTNNRILSETGNLHLVAKEDRVSGKGSTPLMAAFTHIGKASRFTSGIDYGVYYAGDSIDTAIKETVYHQQRFLMETSEPDTALTMRCYRNTAKVPLLDITGDEFVHLHTNDYAPSQVFGQTQRDQGHHGLYYNSVRNQTEGKGEARAKCVAIFKPNAMTIPSIVGHYQYQWHAVQQRITHVFRIEHVAF